MQQILDPPTFEELHPINLKVLASGGVFSPFEADLTHSPGKLISMIKRDGRGHWPIVGALPPIKDEVKYLFRKLFLGTGEDILLIPAQNNPNVLTTSVEDDPRNVFTHKTLEAAEKFSGVLEQDRGRIESFSHLIEVSGAGNLVTFGSPTSNLVARIVMRYFQLGADDDKTSGFRLEPTEAFTLPYSYWLEGKKIIADPNSHSLCERVTNEKKETIPNWGMQEADGDLLYPQVTDTGTLTQDYLLISSLPNMLNMDSFKAKHRIINFGGTHSEGTQAMAQLLTNESILNEISEAVDKAETRNGSPIYWQALLHVDCPLGGTPILNRLIKFEVIKILDEAALTALVKKNDAMIKSYQNL